LKKFNSWEKISKKKEKINNLRKKQEKLAKIEKNNFSSLK